MEAQRERHLAPRGFQVRSKDRHFSATASAARKVSPQGRLDESPGWRRIRLAGPECVRRARHRLDGQAPRLDVRPAVACVQHQVTVGLVDPERHPVAPVGARQRDAREPSSPRSRSVKQWSSLVPPTARPAEVELVPRPGWRSDGIPSRVRPRGRFGPGVQHRRVDDRRSRGQDKGGHRRRTGTASPPTFVAVVEDAETLRSTARTRCRAQVRMGSRAVGVARVRDRRRGGPRVPPTRPRTQRTRPWIAEPVRARSRPAGVAPGEFVAASCDPVGPRA